MVDPIASFSHLPRRHKYLLFTHITLQLLYWGPVRRRLEWSLSRSFIAATSLLGAHGGGLWLVARRVDRIRAICGGSDEDRQQIAELQQALLVGEKEITALEQRCREHDEAQEVAKRERVGLRLLKLLPSCHEQEIKEAQRLLSIVIQGEVPSRREIRAFEKRCRAIKGALEEGAESALINSTASVDELTKAMVVEKRKMRAKELRNCFRELVGDEIVRGFLMRACVPDGELETLGEIYQFMKENEDQARSLQQSEVMFELSKPWTGLLEKLKGLWK